MRRFTSRAAVAAYSGLALLAPAIALAQRTTAPPTPTLNKSAPPWLGYLAIGVLLGAVILVSLFSSKRSHQD